MYIVVDKPGLPEGRKSIQEVVYIKDATSNVLTLYCEEIYLEPPYISLVLLRSIGGQGWAMHVFKLKP